jgi:FKBP-type peptidyl-prolyl cis-trans isomerase
MTSQFENIDAFADKEEDTRPCVELCGDGIDREKLCSMQEHQFEIKLNKDLTDDEKFQQYEPSDVYRYYREDILDMHSRRDAGHGSDENDDDDDKDVSQFERLVRRMEKVTVDGGVKKQILRPGVGSVVERGAHVTVHYNTYLEHSDEPVDSTRLRGKPLSFDLRASDEETACVLPGFDIAVGTMKKNELARFFMEPEYYMGAQGCPPRIPPNAQSIYVIELLNFCERGSCEYYSLPMSERKDAPIELVLAAAKKAKADGNGFFIGKDYYKADKSYRRAVKILVEHHLKDDEEELMAHKLLLPLYSNLCIVNNNIGTNTDAVIRFANDGLRIDPTNAKLLYHKAKALLKKGYLDAAGAELKKAKQCAPGDRNISALLEQINAKWRLQKQAEEPVYRRMFGNVSKDDSNSAAPSKAALKCHQSFKDSLEEKMNAFINDPEISEFPLSSSNFNEDELEYVQQVAEQMNLLSVRQRIDGMTIVRVSKKKPV